MMILDNGLLFVGHPVFVCYHFMTNMWICLTVNMYLMSSEGEHKRKWLK